MKGKGGRKGSKEIETEGKKKKGNGRDRSE